MREYAKVFPKIWIGDTGKKIKKCGIETQLLAQYLISSPHGNMIGVYYLPFTFIAHETGMSSEAISHSMQNLIKLDFCSYDDEKEFVWVHNMIRFQIREALKPKDNLVKNVNSYFEQLPALNFLTEFFIKYQQAFHIKASHPCLRGFKGSLKGDRSQEQEQEKEQEQEIEKEQALDQDSDTHVLTIPLQNNKDFFIKESMINDWQLKFSNLSILPILESIKNWNIQNPDKRKTESGIMNHINLWLSKENEKINNLIVANKNTNSLFNFNQNIAEEWLKEDSFNFCNEVH